MRRYGRATGATVGTDGLRVCLQVWGKHFDEVVILDTEEAKNLAAQLITAVAEISRLTWDS